MCPNMVAPSVHAAVSAGECANTCRARAHASMHANTNTARARQAIRLVANKLFSLRFLVADIEKFAIENLRKACNVDSSAVADGDAVMAEAGGGAEGAGGAVVKKEGGGVHFVRDVHLFMALCAKRCGGVCGRRESIISIGGVVC